MATDDPGGDESAASARDDGVAIADGVHETAVRDVANDYFDDVSPCHDWYHVERVVATAKRLADDTASPPDGAEGVDPTDDTDDFDTADVDRGVLVAAAWLHDVGRAKESRGEIDDHAEWGASEARSVLADLDVDDADMRDAVAHCVRAHRYSNDVEPETREAELLCDADNLDATGAVGVARVFAYAGEHDRTLYDPDRPPAEDDSPAGETSFNHFHKKILNLRERMYTDAGRRVAADRHDYVESFLERFEREAHGRD